MEKQNEDVKKKKKENKILLKEVIIAENSILKIAIKTFTHSFIDYYSFTMFNTSRKKKREAKKIKSRE